MQITCSSVNKLTCSSVNCNVVDVVVAVLVFVRYRGSSASLSTEVLMKCCADLLVLHQHLCVRKRAKFLKGRLASEQQQICKPPCVVVFPAQCH